MSSRSNVAVDAELLAPRLIDVGDLGGVQQRLGRDAAAVQAGAADLVRSTMTTVRPSSAARSARRSRRCRRRGRRGRRNWGQRDPGHGGASSRAMRRRCPPPFVTLREWPCREAVVGPPRDQCLLLRLVGALAGLSWCRRRRGCCTDRVALVARCPLAGPALASARCLGCRRHAPDVAEPDSGSPAPSGRSSPWPACRSRSVAASDTYAPWSPSLPWAADLRHRRDIGAVVLHVGGQAAGCCLTARPGLGASVLAGSGVSRSAGLGVGASSGSAVASVSGSADARRCRRRARVWCATPERHGVSATAPPTPPAASAHATAPATFALATQWAVHSAEHGTSMRGIGVDPVPSMSSAPAECPLDAPFGWFAQALHARRRAPRGAGRACGPARRCRPWACSRAARPGCSSGRRCRGGPTSRRPARTPGGTARP